MSGSEEGESGYGITLVAGFSWPMGESWGTIAEGGDGSVDG